MIGDMPKRKEPKPEPKEQFKRFVETAREHGVDETGREMERLFKRVLRPVEATKKKPR